MIIANNREVSILLDIFKQFFSSDWYWGEYEKDGERFTSLAQDRFSELDSFCKFRIPRFFSEAEPNAEPRNVKRRKLSEKFKDSISEYEKNPTGFDWALKGLKTWRDNLSAVAVRVQDEVSFFEGNAKGTRRYQQKMYWRVHDFCMCMDSGWKGSYFITLTCGEKMRAQGVFKAWELFSKELGKFSKKLRAHFGCELCTVLEAHESGFPHAHMIMYLPKFIGDEKEHYSRRQKRKYVVGGSVRRFIDKFWKCGFADLQKNARKGTANYLSKYIAKSADGSLKELLKKKELTKSEKKMLLTIIMPIMTGVRGFRFSQAQIGGGVTLNKFLRECDDLPKAARDKLAGKSLKKRVSLFEEMKKNGELQSETERFLSEQLAFVRSEGFTVLSDAERRSYLIKLCTNLLFACEKRVRVTSYSRLDKECEGDIFDGDPISAERKAEIFDKCAPLKCEGCIITHLLNKIRTGHDEWFDKGIKTSNFNALRFISNRVPEPMKKAFRDFSLQADPRTWVFHPLLRPLGEDSGEKGLKLADYKDTVFYRHGARYSKDRTLDFVLVENDNLTGLVKLTRKQKEDFTRSL